MKIESLKHLLAEKIDYDEEYFSHDTYKEALLLAIEALEQSSGYWVANKDCLEEIEKIFN